MARYIVVIDGKAGGYGVIFPDCPGATAMGTTMDEALDNAALALRDWAEITEEHGSRLPAARSLEALRKDPDVKDALASGASIATIPLVRETGRPIKANLSIDSGVLQAIDDEAARRKLTRSAMVELMARTILPKI
jgi:predicted RNase H-like HicB family nuclease